MEDEEEEEDDDLTEEEKKEAEAMMKNIFGAMGMDANGAGGMPGMPGQQQQQQQPGATSSPQLGEVCHITSLVQLQTIIRSYHGVVIDFWSPTCRPCVRFKPQYEANARANRNKHIVFCAVQCDVNRECAQAFQV